MVAAAALLLLSSFFAIVWGADEIRHAQPAAMTIAEASCGSSFGRHGADLSQSARSATAFPEWAGCAETWETKPDEAPPLVLRCRRGSISAIEEAVLGRPSGRCEPAAFLVQSEDERQQLAVEYARPADQGLCDAVDFRRVAAADCVGKASCTLELRHILTATNTHPGSCHGLLLRAAARFRCGTAKDRFEGGEGHRDVAWFDEDLTRAELAEAVASEERSRGYAAHDPVYTVAGSPERPVACGFGYEGDFVNVVCDGAASLERLPAEIDALDVRQQGRRSSQWHRGRAQDRRGGGCALRHLRR
jgi:hypothetical protein